MPAYNSDSHSYCLSFIVITILAKSDSSEEGKYCKIVQISQPIHNPVLISFMCILQAHELNCTQLREYLKAQGVRGISRLKKEELVALAYETNKKKQKL